MHLESRQRQKAQAIKAKKIVKWQNRGTFGKQT
jgi:hypothetical protein